MINFNLFRYLDVLLLLLLPPPPLPLPLFFSLHFGTHTSFVLKIRLGDVRAANTVNYEARGEERTVPNRQSKRKEQVYCTRSLWSVYLLWLFAILINCEFLYEWRCRWWVCRRLNLRVLFSLTLSLAHCHCDCTVYYWLRVCVCKKVCLFYGMRLYASNPVTIERYSLVETMLHF